MVRAAVKTLTLNVYAIPLPSLRAFVTTPPAAAYFAQLAGYGADACRRLEELVSAWEERMPGTPAAVEGCLAEIEDVVSYCNDVIGTGTTSGRI